MIGRAVGEIVAIRAAAIDATLPFARVGDGVRICARDARVHARVAALHGTRATLAPFGEPAGIAPGDRAELDAGALTLPLGTPLLGRAVDAIGAPLDGKGPARGRAMRADARDVELGARRACSGTFWTGVRAIDGPLPIARGARVGIFGPPGAGKSTLLDAIVRGARADAVVVALIGERGREAERRLADVGLRMTVVCATADRAPAERIRAAEVAFAQAAALRARGLDVLLVLDSLARIGAAQRELALAAGEPAGRGGYPASTFSVMTKLLERAGPAERGTVTLLATVLSEGPDERDPVSEAARAALDGHFVLCERLANGGHHPALDVIKSVSRTSAEAASPEHRAAARTMRAALATLERSRDTRELGLTIDDPFVRRCVAAEPELIAFLRQGAQPSPPGATLTALRRLADILK